MPLTASAVSAGIQGIASIAKFITGASQVKHGREEQRKNIRPDFDIQREYYNNQSLAQSNAQHGLSESAMDYYTTGSQRGLTSGIDAALETGGGVNQIQSLYDQYNRGLAGTSAYDSQLQNDKFNTLYAINKDMAGQKTMRWVLNKYEPFKDRAKAAADEIRAGQQNKQTAAEEFVGAGSSFATSMLSNDLNKNGGTPGATSASGTTSFAVPSSNLRSDPRYSMPGFEQWYKDETGDDRFSKAPATSMDEITRLLSGYNEDELIFKN